ncbi:MAG: hypoxanthine phosphoribosyltransferase [Paludibacteraceae bacterium]|nr:hypoxanthine phosphoribosyltransferase [Paludibacteraceae bacterium]
METIQVDDKVFKPYLSAKEITQRVSEMAQELRNQLTDTKNLLFVGMLSGSFVFVADFVRAYGKPAEVQFVKCSSYQGTQSTGCLKEELALGVDVKGRTVVILEDIIETGLTMQQFVASIKKGQPACVKVVSLFYKPQLNKSTITPDMVGFSIPNDFIVGYGLDYNHQGRNLPDVYSVIAE